MIVFILLCCLSISNASLLHLRALLQQRDAVPASPDPVGPPLPPPDTTPCPVMDCWLPAECFYQGATFDDQGCQLTCGDLLCVHCREDQEWSDCNAHCQRECDSPDPMICSRICTPGCVCKSGLVLLDGRCVTPDQCRGEIPHGCQGDGQMCGGITGSQCPQGSTCVQSQQFPDSSGVCQCNVACPIMDCFFPDFCEWRSDPTWDENGCQLTCGTCEIPHGCQGDGQRCGGFVGTQCPQGSTCVNDQQFPDSFGVCQCNVACPIMDCFPPDFCEWSDPTYDENGCQSTCGTLLCEIPHGCQGDGQMCGGFVGTQCPQGSTCVNDQHFPDSSGVCQCNVACPILDCHAPDFCQWTNPTYDENGCQSGCGTLACEEH